jgi:hypothetical protein
LRTDLERLLVEGDALVRTAPVRALFEVLLTESGQPQRIRAGTRPFLRRSSG